MRLNFYTKALYSACGFAAKSNVEGSETMLAMMSDLQV